MIVKEGQMEPSAAGGAMGATACTSRRGAGDMGRGREMATANDTTTTCRVNMSPTLADEMVTAAGAINAHMYTDARRR